MTHSVCGNIVTFGPFLEYNNALVHRVATRFFISSGTYVTLHDLHDKVVIYSKLAETQPFIDVLNKPVELSKWNKNLKGTPLEERPFLLLSVRSGSHVGFADTSYVQEIYKVTMKFRTLLQKDLPRKMNLEVLFDDERQLYLPSNFRKYIKQNAA